MDAVITPELGERFRELKRYVRFGEDDARHLAAFLPRARPHFPHIVQIFYERVREHEEAFSVFGDESALRRMHGLLVAWLERMLSGPYDEDYAEKSCNIGRVHVRVGMPQRFMFTAMSVFRQNLQAIGLEGASEPALHLALDKILDVELALMNDAYEEALLARTRRIERGARTRMLGDLKKETSRSAQGFFLAGSICIALDAQGEVLLANRRASDVLELARGELDGRSFTALVAEGAEAFVAALGQAVASAERVRLPVAISLRASTGRIRRLEGSLSRDPQEEHGEIFVLLTGDDVTEEEAALARVRQTQRLAAVGTLAAGLAHEIRNPLNGAQLHITYIERALKRRGGETELEEAIGVVAGEIARLSALVNEFLDFARPAKPETRPTDITPLCRHVAAISANEATQVSVEVDLPRSPLIAEADRHKIEQVLLNLLRNAVEACEDSAGNVIIRAYREPRFAVVEIHDDGPGFNTESPIFDAFFSTKAQGTGMGLAIAHRIVEDHGGTIEAQSRPGETIFRVRLPIAEPRNIE